MSPCDGWRELGFNVTGRSWAEWALLTRPISQLNGLGSFRPRPTTDGNTVVPFPSRRCQSGCSASAAELPKPLFPYWPPPEPSSLESWAPATPNRALFSPLGGGHRVEFVSPSFTSLHFIVLINLSAIVEGAVGQSEFGFFFISGEMGKIVSPLTGKIVNSGVMLPGFESNVLGT